MPSDNPSSYCAWLKRRLGAQGHQLTSSMLQTKLDYPFPWMFSLYNTHRMHLRTATYSVHFQKAKQVQSSWENHIPFGLLTEARANWRGRRKRSVVWRKPERGGDGISVPHNFHQGISSWDKGPGHFRRLFHYNHRNSSDAFPEGALGPCFIPQIPDLHQLFGIINKQSVCFKGISMETIVRNL